MLRRALRDERGTAATLLLFPIFAVVTFMFIQALLWQHDRQTAASVADRASSAVASVHPDDVSRSPPRHAPSPRTALNRSPLAWLATSPTAGPALSTRHSAVAYHGTPRLAFVDPSSGSITTVSAPRGPVIPLSSESTAYPAPCRSSTARSSVTTSTAYWPTRCPDAPHSVVARSWACTASATSWNSVKAG